MATSTGNHTTSTELLCYFIASFEDSFGLPDGQFVVYHQAYDPITQKPVGPWHGDTNPAYVRLWMADRYPDALEVTMQAVTR